MKLEDCEICVKREQKAQCSCLEPFTERPHGSTLLTNLREKSMQSSFISFYRLQAFPVMCWHDMKDITVKSKWFLQGSQISMRVVEMNSLWQPTSCPSPKLDNGYMSDNYTYGPLQQMLPWTKVLSRKTTPFTNCCFHEISSKVAHHATQYSIYNLLRYKIFGNKRKKITTSKDTMVIVLIMKEKYEMYKLSKDD